MLLEKETKMPGDIAQKNYSNCPLKKRPIQYYKEETNIETKSGKYQLFLLLINYTLLSFIFTKFIKSYYFNNFINKKKYFNNDINIKNSPSNIL